MFFEPEKKLQYLLIVWTGPVLAERKSIAVFVVQLSNVAELLKCISVVRVFWKCVVRTCFIFSGERGNAKYYKARFCGARRQAAPASVFQISPIVLRTPPAQSARRGSCRGWWVSFVLNRLFRACLYRCKLHCDCKLFLSTNYPQLISHALRWMLLYARSYILVGADSKTSQQFCAVNKSL